MDLGNWSNETCFADPDSCELGEHLFLELALLEMNENSSVQSSVSHFCHNAIAFVRTTPMPRDNWPICQLSNHTLRSFLVKFPDIAFDYTQNL